MSTTGGRPGTGPQPPGRAAAPSTRTTVRREPDRGSYDRAAVDAVLDAAVLCHLAFVHDGQPYAVPTLYARDGGTLLVHGSAAGRALRACEGAPVCVTVSLLDAIVLARSVFGHSVNYRSAMVLGVPRRVEGDAKAAALEAITERVLPGRWAEARAPSPQELAATTVLALPLDEASAKVRTGPPGDGAGPDAALPVWAGVVPLVPSWGEPVPDAGLRADIPLPTSVRRLLERGSQGP